MGAGFELTLNVIKGGFGDGGGGRNEMRTEEEVLISLIRLGRRGRGRGSRGEDCGLRRCFFGRSVRAAFIVRGTRQQSNTERQSAKLNEVEAGLGRQVALGLPSLEIIIINKKKKKPETFQCSLVPIIEFVVPFCIFRFNEKGAVQGLKYFVTFESKKTKTDGDTGQSLPRRPRASTLAFGLALTYTTSRKNLKMNLRPPFFVVATVMQ